MNAQPDRFLRGLGKVVTVYERLSRLDRGRQPVRAQDRSLRLRITDIQDQAEDVRSLTLTGDALPRWQPGAHLDVLLPSGRMRQYSLCGDPADRHSYRIAVRRIADGGGGSREMHRLRVGDTLTVRGPRNAFPFIPARRYLFLAGGIGLTPILPMVRAAAAAGVDWQFVYCGRSLESMPFLDELARLDQHRIWIRPDTEYGIPASGAELLERAPHDARIYCCGPIPMINSVRLDAPEHSAVHFERFSEPPIVDGRAFGITLARSGQTLTVPADRSALDVLREARPDVAYSCKQGFCGTCKVRVLHGEPEHRDHALSPQERTEHMTVCVSRACGPGLTLDI